MVDLSPAAQAVLNAYHRELPPDNEPGGLATALRVVADLELQSPWPTSIEGCGARWMRDRILAIAAELEALQ